MIILCIALLYVYYLSLSLYLSTRTISCHTHCISPRHTVPSYLYYIVYADLYLSFAFLTLTRRHIVSVTLRSMYNYQFVSRLVISKFLLFIAFYINSFFFIFQYDSEQFTQIRVSLQLCYFCLCHLVLP